MNSLLLLIIAIVAFFIAYVTYGRWLAKKWGIDIEKPTPANTLKDGIDYVPSDAKVILGHHFSSIAGAGPITGPIAASIFGWLPVYLWIIIGSIFIGGIDVARLKDRKVYILRRKLGVVFQDFKLLPKLTVFENVAFAMEVFGYDKAQIQKRVLEVLDLVGLKNKVRQYPTQLSGGEQQRVVIARAIVNNPKLLICDEPTGNLDPDTSMEIMKVLENINNLGTTVIMATHDRDIVDKMKKRVILIENGRLKKDYEKGTYYNERY